MIATSYPGLRDACDDIVDELIATHPGQRPDAIEIAKRLGIEVRFDSKAVGQARVRRLSDHETLVVKPGKSTEKLQWAVAHELGERLAQRVFEKLQEDSELDDVPSSSFVLGGQLREQIANEFAGRLLLPRRSFLHAVDTFDGDLLAIKQQFPNASYDLILLGLLRWPGHSVVSIFADGQSIRRFGNLGVAPKLSPLEHEAWAMCRRSARTTDFTEDGVRVQVWAIREGKEQRELMRTTPCNNATTPARSRYCHERQFELFELDGTPESQLAVA